MSRQINMKRDRNKMTNVSLSSQAAAPPQFVWTLIMRMQPETLDSCLLYTSPGLA